MDRRQFNVQLLISYLCGLFIKEPSAQATEDNPKGLPVLRWNNEGTIANADDILKDVPWEVTPIVPGLERRTRAVRVWVPKETPVPQSCHHMAYGEVELHEWYKSYVRVNVCIVDETIYLRRSFTMQQRIDE